MKKYEHRKEFQTAVLKVVNNPQQPVEKISELPDMLVSHSDSETGLYMTYGLQVDPLSSRAHCYREYDLATLADITKRFLTKEAFPQLDGTPGTIMHVDDLCKRVARLVVDDTMERGNLSGMLRGNDGITITLPLGRGVQAFFYRNQMDWFRYLGEGEICNGRLRLGRSITGTAMILGYQYKLVIEHTDLNLKALVTEELLTEALHDKLYTQFPFLDMCPNFIKDLTFDKFGSMRRKTDKL